jgi:hypothetical protein
MSPVKFMEQQADWKFHNQLYVDQDLGHRLLEIALAVLPVGSFPGLVYFGGQAVARHARRSRQTLYARQHHRLERPDRDSPCFEIINRRNKV